MLERIAALLAGLWGGVLLGIGAIGAPAGFAVIPLELAGRSAGRMFAVEAYVSLAIAVVLLLLLRRTAASRGDSGFNTEILLVLGSLFCLIVGYFVLQPMMAAARAGQGSMSFASLHALAGLFFAAKTLIVIALAWRLSPSPDRSQAGRSGTPRP